MLEPLVTGRVAPLGARPPQKRPDYELPARSSRRARPLAALRAAFANASARLARQYASTRCCA